MRLYVIFVEWFMVDIVCSLIVLVSVFDVVLMIVRCWIEFGLVDLMLLNSGSRLLGECRF